MKWFLFTCAMVFICGNCEAKLFPDKKDLYAHSLRGMLQLGDSSHWKELTYDDAHWHNYLEKAIDTVFWVRLPVVLSDNEDIQELGVSISAIANYEAYWDGHYLGKNGNLKNRGQVFKPGPYRKVFRIPEHLSSPGEHIIALRATNSAYKVGFHAFAFIDDYQWLLRSPLQLSKNMFLLAGMFLIVFFHFFLLYLNTPKQTYLLSFSTICLLFTALLFMEYLKFYHPYPFTFQRSRLEIIEGLHLALGLLVPVFFLQLFNISNRRLFSGLVILALALVLFFCWRWEHGRFDHTARLLTRVMWFASLIVVVVASLLRRQGAKVALGGLCFAFLAVRLARYSSSVYISDYDLGIFLGFTGCVLTVLYILKLKRKTEQEAFEASLVQSERLKNELLKKSIKPHFIMNTLTSLIDWMEESPKKGVAFIHSLAEEFDILNDIADEKLIPITQEIELCNNHLEVMSFRKEISYEWSDEGIDQSQLIPPAILHTIVENGITHSLPMNGKVKFHLKYDEYKFQKEYHLYVYARNRSRYSKKESAGTGLKYIRSRLAESYKSNWSLVSNPTADGWETIITIGK